MATALGTGIITMMFNGIMLRYAGEDRVAAAFALTRPLVSVFARPDNPVYDLAVAGSRLCISALFFIGFHIFASRMFAAVSNRVVTAVLAFSRSFIFMPITMLVLVLFFGLTGIWLAMSAAELIAPGLFLKYGKRYGYLGIKNEQ